MNLILRVLPFSLLAAFSQEPPAPPYKFVKDSATKYEVVGDLRISLKGSHKDFLKDGDEPITMSYKVLFENVVLEVNDGSARMERRVRTLTAEGFVVGMPFKYKWDRAKDAGKPAGANEGPDTVAGLFRKWCVQPLQFRVDANGQYATSEEHYDRLVNKAGVMYWVVAMDGKPWATEETIAVPLLHDKITIEFKNTVAKAKTENGKKILEIAATPGLKEAILPPPGVPRPADGGLDYTVVATKNKIEVDTTNRRLHSVNLDLNIKLSGKGPVAGGMGDIKGEVKFTESQTYKD